MTLDWSHGPVQIIEGDVRVRLRDLPGESVQCVVTSPPYWGLRVYGTAPQVWSGRSDCEHAWGDTLRVHKGGANGGGPVMNGRDPSAREAAREFSAGALCRACGAWRGELGLEPTVALYLDHIVDIFRDVRRVLRSDGTLWLNLGDSHFSAGYSNHAINSEEWKADMNGDKRPSRQQDLIRSNPELKPKDLLGMPWRIALALQADGWWLRADIIWHKPNPMPESVTDRPTRSHEYVFLLAKSAHYFYDAHAIRERAVSEGNRTPAGWDTGEGAHRRLVGRYARGSGNKARVFGSNENGIPNDHRGRGVPWTPNGYGRNKRSVWTIPTEAFPEAHFATFPEALVEPCIKAGTSEAGACKVCGCSCRRIGIDRAHASGSGRSGNAPRGKRVEPLQGGGTTGDVRNGPVRSERTVGWEPGCACPESALNPEPCIVLDPFAGSGTTLLVAAKLGRRAVGIELKTEYADMAKARLSAWRGQERLADYATTKPVQDIGSAKGQPYPGLPERTPSVPTSTGPSIELPGDAG